MMTLCYQRDIKCRNVKGIVLHADACLPQSIAIPTVIAEIETCDMPHFPCLESILGANNVHDCWVSLSDQRGVEHRFLVSCERHRDHAHKNKTLKALLPDLTWRGDIIVMRGGSRASVVNLGGVVMI